LTSGAGTILGQGGQDSRHQSLVSSRITVASESGFIANYGSSPELEIALCRNNKRSPNVLQKKKSSPEMECLFRSKIGVL